MGNDTSREIREHAYDDCDTLLRAYVSQRRKNFPVKTAARRQAASPILIIPKMPREIRWLLAKHREEFDPEEQVDLDRLLQFSQEVSTLRRLLRQFLNMIRQRKHEQLGSWMQKALNSRIPELKSFVTGVERDGDAVKAALRLLWREAHHGREGHQAQNAQKSHVLQGWVCSLEATPLPRCLVLRQYVAELKERGMNFTRVSPKRG